MRISMRKQRRAAGRPGALPNLRRICNASAAIKPVPRHRKKGYAVDFAVDVLLLSTFAT